MVCHVLLAIDTVVDQLHAGCALEQVGEVGLEDTQDAADGWDAKRVRDEAERAQPGHGHVHVIVVQLFLRDVVLEDLAELTHELPAMAHRKLNGRVVCSCTF